MVPAGFDYNFGFGFYGQLKTIYGKYITNHDVNSSDGTPLDLFGGANGLMAAFVVAAYMKGVPMIYNGQEVGTPFRITLEVAGEKVLVISNLRNRTINYVIPPDLVNSTWTDALNGGSVSITTKVTLQPYEYLALKQ